MNIGHVTHVHKKLGPTQLNISLPIHLVLQENGISDSRNDGLANPHTAITAIDFPKKQSSDYSHPKMLDLQ